MDNMQVRDRKAIIKPDDQSKQRAHFKKLLKMYENDWADLLEERLRTIFHPEIFSRIRLLKDKTINLFRRIVNVTSTVYKKPAKRELSTGDNKRWEELQKSLNLNVVMKEAQRLAKACTIVFLRPYVVPGTREIKIDVITPDLVHVEVDTFDKQKMKSFAYCSEIKTEKGIQTVWTYYSTEQILFLNDQGKILEKNPFTGETYDSKNPYDIIPVIPFPARPQVRKFFEEHLNEDSYEANLIVAVLKTYLNDIVKMQSFKQPVIEGELLCDKDIVLDPASPLQTKLGGKIYTLDLTTANIKDINDFIMWQAYIICNNYGVSSENFTLSADAESGFSLQIKNYALEEIREDDIGLCDSVEKELYKTIAAVNNREYAPTWIQIADKLPEDAELYFNPGEVKFPRPWDEEEKQWTFEMKQGISNAIDYMISKDPELTREDALKILVEKKAENEKLKPYVSPLDKILGGNNSEAEYADA